MKSAQSAIVIWLIGAVLLGFDLTNLWSPTSLLELGDRQRWWLLLPLTVGAAALLLKRRHPVGALAVGTLCFLVDMVVGGGTLGILLVIFDLLFTVGLYATARMRWLVTALFVLGAVVLATLVAVTLRELRMVFFIGMQFTALIVVPLWWAANLRQHRELAELAEGRAAAERDRADLAREHARDQSRLADLARLEAVQHERAAMARDIHDVIASHLSSVAIHSGAALSRPADPEADRRALQVVREESLASLTEMRAMISLLSSPDGSTDADEVPGGLDRLDRLVAGFRARGSEVTVRTDDLSDLPCEVDRAAYRIIHEALTNASKHAPGQPIRLAVGRTADAVEVAVDNPLAADPDLAGGTAAEDSLHSGIGLVSMRERSTGLGGAFRAGPHETGTWQVRARLPITDQPGVRTPDEAGPAFDLSDETPSTTRSSGVAG